MSKKEKKELIVPTYKWVEEEGGNDVPPIKRKISKTMEITENFNYYDTLAYVMKMEKAIEDKRKEIEGLETMIKAYRDELELIEDTLHVNEEERKWNIELHEKLKEEESKKESGETSTTHYNCETGDCSACNENK